MGNGANMNRDEQKAYIIKTWNTSSGERITKMLKKYWASDKSDSQVATAKEIFNI